MNRDPRTCQHENQHRDQGRCYLCGGFFSEAERRGQDRDVSPDPLKSTRDAACDAHLFSRAARQAPLTKAQALEMIEQYRALWPEILEIVHTHAPTVSPSPPADLRRLPFPHSPPEPKMKIDFFPFKKLKKSGPCGDDGLPDGYLRLPNDPEYARDFVREGSALAAALRKFPIGTAVEISRAAVARAHPSWHIAVQNGAWFEVKNHAFRVKDEPLIEVQAVYNIFGTTFFNGHVVPNGHGVTGWFRPDDLLPADLLHGFSRAKVKA